MDGLDEQTKKSPEMKRGTALVTALVQTRYGPSNGDHQKAKQKAQRSEELCLPLPLRPKKGSFVLSSFSFLPSVLPLLQLRPSFVLFLPSFGDCSLVSFLPVLRI